MALFSGIFVYTYANRNKIKSIYEWKSLSNSFKNIKSVTAYRQYGQLYADLKDDCCFLYDYAYMLHEKGEYDKALMIIKECDKKIADYDVILLMGDIYNDMGNYSKAIDCYTLAHNMCPCRFAPLCAIYDIYKQQCKITECKLLAREIMEKKIKVRSPETMEYVNYIEKEIKILNL